MVLPEPSLAAARLFSGVVTLPVLLEHPAAMKSASNVRRRITLVFIISTRPIKIFVAQDSESFATRTGVNPIKRPHTPTV
jgi:hypothetical protein